MFLPNKKKKKRLSFSIRGSHKMRIKLDFELKYLLPPNMNNNHKLEQMVFEREMEENMKDSIRVYFFK